MTLNGVMAVILRYFSDFAYLPGVLRKSLRKQRNREIASLQSNSVLQHCQITRKILGIPRIPKKHFARSYVHSFVLPKADVSSVLFVQKHVYRHFLHSLTAVSTMIYAADHLKYCISTGRCSGSSTSLTRVSYTRCCVNPQTS